MSKSINANTSEITRTNIEVRGGANSNARGSLFLLLFLYG
jgi:hypothetical protein